MTTKTVILNSGYGYTTGTEPEAALPTPTAADIAEPSGVDVSLKAGVFWLPQPCKKNKLLAGRVAPNNRGFAAELCCLWDVIFSYLYLTALPTELCSVDKG